MWSSTVSNDMVKVANMGKLDRKECQPTSLGVFGVLKTEPKVLSCGVIRKVRGGIGSLEFQALEHLLTQTCLKTLIEG